VPKHKEYAAQAKQIAEQTLHASDKDLDKLASQLVALNKGHGWSKSRQLDDQMRYAAWEALCAENTEAKQDVMRMSEDTARFDPVMKKLHSLLHRDAQSAKAAQTRNEDSRLIKTSPDGLKRRGPGFRMTISWQKQWSSSKFETCATRL
jgi:hypothetical protein